MRIDSVSVQVPSLEVTNDDILQWIRDHSDSAPDAMVTTYQRLVRSLLHRAGAVRRYIRDRRCNERAATLVVRAMRDALANADIAPADIDLLIYCGVGKGFLEPANAYFYARALGMQCSCFDVGDACMSWIRALQIADQFLRSGEHQRVLVVNGEFNAHRGMPANFRVTSIDQLQYLFPTYTIGEAASATVLSASDQQWRFAFKAVPELCDLCTIALDEYADFVEPSPRMAKNGVHNFVAYGAEMFDNAELQLSALLRETIDDLDAPDIYFPHAASSTRYLTAGSRVGIDPEKMYARVFPSYGNLVSASIPAGLTMALAEGRLRRGARTVFCPASAGMVYGVVQFEF